MAARTHNRAKSPKRPNSGSNGRTREAKTLQTKKCNQHHSVNTNYGKQSEDNKWSVTRTGEDALKLVMENESTANGQSQKNKKAKPNWEEFRHLSLTWFMSAFAIAVVLIILSLEEQSTNLFHDVINRIDTLSLMLSLVLSAALEQIWNYKNSKIFQYSLAGELILVISGLVWYLVCSIHEIQVRNPLYEGTVNSVFIERFGVHAVYIVLSTCCVFVGFLARVSVGQGEK